MFFVWHGNSPVSSRKFAAGKLSGIHIPETWLRSVILWNMDPASTNWVRDDRKTIKKK